jgi:hypothetical protein
MTMAKKTPNIDTSSDAYEQGRRARLSSIDKQDAPYDAGTDALTNWQAGFDGAEGEAARNATSGPDSDPAAEGQLDTASKK